MKQIRSVKLAMNKNADVIMLADVEMGANDIDSLFLCYFTILTPPLRMSVLTSGQLVEKLSVIMNVDKSVLLNLLQNNPEEYAKYVQNYTNELIAQADEQSRIVLDNDDSANQGRALIASILKSGYYLQKTKFHFPDGTVQEQEQKIDIKGMEQTFRAMLDICKNWRDVEVEA
jgi:hypothetical protein